MKRAGYIYEQMAQWENIVEAENVATKRKNRNPGVQRHIKSRFKNLCEIQQMVLEGRMRTDEYMHEQRISGQNKLRDISKVYFHPSHIEHQLLTMAADRRVDRSLIRHTYASRKGYGQIACALSIKKNLRKYRGQERWYAQGDGRYALRVHFMGDTYKLIVNAAEIKTFLADMTRNKVTRFKTVFIDRGSMRYGIDEEKTDILEVNGRTVIEENGDVVFEDTKEIVSFV